MAAGKHGETWGGVRWLLIVAGVIVVVAGLKTAQPILLPFLVAVFLSVLSTPLLALLLRLRLSNGLAVFITMLAVVGVAVGIGTLVGGSIQGFQEAVPRYRSGLLDIQQSVTTWLADRNIDLAQFASLDQINAGVIFDTTVGVFRAFAAVISNVVLVLLTMTFILIEAAELPAKLRAAMGESETSRLSSMVVEVQRYLAIKTLVSLATGIAIAVFLSLVGVDFPLLWGLLAFLLNYIPNLGSMFAAVPPTLLALIQLGPIWALVVAGGFVVVNVTIGNIIEPQLLGRKLGLSPLVVFLSLVFWGWVWGPVGMLLSVPLTMILKIMLENTNDFRWIAILLGGRPPEASTRPAVESATVDASSSRGSDSPTPTDAS